MGPCHWWVRRRTGPVDRMTLLPRFGYAIILLCLLASADSLSPPQNLTVNLLDFKMNVDWIIDKENPPGTKYAVELLDLDHNESEWTAVGNCKNLTVHKCQFSFPLEFDELLKHYAVRVKVAQRSKNFSVCYERIIQPYGDSVLSGPRLAVTVQDDLIYAVIQHSVEAVLPNLTYYINLTQRSSEKDILVSTVHSAASPWTFPSTHLNPGHFYCVSASANHRQQQQYHSTSQECVFLHKPPIVKAMINMVLGTLVPLTLLILLLLVAFFFYLKPRNDEVHLPPVLNNVGTTTRTLVVPTERMVQPQLVILELNSVMPEGCPTPPCHHYSSRMVVQNSSLGSAFPEPVAEGDVHAGLELQGSPYHAVNDEESSSSSEGLDFVEEAPSSGLSDGDEDSEMPSSSEDEPYDKTHKDCENGEEMQEVESPKPSDSQEDSEMRPFSSGYESRPDPCSSDHLSK